MTEIDDAVQPDAVQPDRETAGSEDPPPTPDELQQRLPEELAEIMGGRPVVLRIVRHAETEYNVGHVMQGWSDSPITERGRAQIEAVGRMLADERFDLAFSSDLQRTRTTAEGIVAARSERLDVRFRDELREWNFGGHEERPSFDVWSEVIVEHGFEVDRELTALRAIAEQVGWRGLFDAVAGSDPSGEAEQAAAIVARADGALAHMLSAAASVPGDDAVRVLVVSHGGFITSLLRQLVPDVTPDAILPNCSVTTVSLPAGSRAWSLDSLGETAP